MWTKIGYVLYRKSSERPGTYCALVHILICLGQSGTYGAAAADIAPNIGSGVCSGSIDPSKCNGQSPAAGWVPPTCPKTNCGKCYTVTHTGGIGSSVGGVGNSITVQIIDACPSTSAANFCKTDVPSNQRCGDSGTNQLDIDKSAYMALTGQPFGGVSTQTFFTLMENRMLIIHLLGTHADDIYHANVLPRRPWLLWFGILKSRLYASDSF